MWRGLGECRPVSDRLLVRTARRARSHCFGVLGGARRPCSGERDKWPRRARTGRLSIEGGPVPGAVEPPCPADGVGDFVAHLERRVRAHQQFEGEGDPGAGVDGDFPPRPSHRHLVPRDTLLDAGNREGARDRQHVTDPEVPLINHSAGVDGSSRGPGVHEDLAARGLLARGRPAPDAPTRPQPPPLRAARTGPRSIAASPRQRRRVRRSRVLRPLRSLLALRRARCDHRSYRVRHQGAPGPGGPGGSGLSGCCGAARGRRPPAPGGRRGAAGPCGGPWGRAGRRSRR